MFCITEKGVFGYGTCSKCLAYSIESQVEGFREQTSMVKSFSRLAAGFGIPEKVSGEVHFKKIFRLATTFQNCTL